MKNLSLFALLLIALPASAQTITNPSFETAQPMSGTIAGVGSWNNGPIPGWTANGAWGSFQPTGFAALPDGPTVAWSNGGTLSQDLGQAATANTIYTLTVSVGQRPDGLHGTYSLALNAGTTNFTTLCTVTGTNATVPLGTFQDVSASCPVGAIPPAGNLSIVLTSGGVQVEFDNVRLTVGTPGPFVLKLAGLTNLTFLLSDPSQLPACTPADGVCSLTIAVCFTDSGQCANGVKGSVSVVKITNASTSSTQVIQASP